jgi:glycosyltransferase involved in cell wall biosynthesis
MQLSKAGKPGIAMIGTSFETMGGVAAVVRGYRDAGLFERCRVIYLVSHQDGNYLVKLLRAITCLFELISVCIRYPIKIAHFHMASRQSFWRKFLLFMVCRMFKIKCILHLHGAEFMQFYDLDAGYVTRRCIAFLFDRADHIIVLSPRWKEKISTFTKNNSVSVVFNAVPLPDLRAAASSDAEPCVVFLGRLGNRKGAFDLLRAFQEVIKTVPNVQLVCAGDGELEKARELADELGIGEHIEIPGWIGPNAKEHLLRRATLFVLPSYAEGLPMSLLEAMAAGLPVVTTNVGGIPDIVTNGVEGFVIEPGDVAALGVAMTSILQDDELCIRLGTSARKRIESELSIDTAIDKVEAVYRELGYS